MEKNPSQLSERILTITLEIIYLLTGEDYGPVNKVTENVMPNSNSNVSGGFRSTPSPSMEMPPNSSVQEKSREQKILELSKKITELLSGEVAVRWQDVTVYFSMEEWEYLEGHKEQYKGMMLSPDLANAKYELGELSTPFLPPSYLKNEYDFHTAVQEVRCPTVGDLNLIHHQEMFTKKATSCDAMYLIQGICPSIGHIKQDIPNNFQRLFNEDDKKRKKCINSIFLDHPYAIPARKIKKRILTDADSPTTTNTPEYLTFQINEVPTLYDIGGVTYTGLQTPMDSIQSNTVHIKEESMSQEIKSSVTDNMQEYKCSHIKEEPVSSEVSNLPDFSTSTELPQGQFHIKEEPISYDEDYTKNTAINTPTFHTHHHTGYQFQEEPPSEIDIYLPPDTEHTVSRKTVHRRHVRQKTNLDKPFLCTECGKSFVCQSGLSTHTRMHMLKKQHTCTECNKTFLSKPYLVRHQMMHSGEKKYSCEDCGRCFSKASHLNVHQKVHNRKGPFSCTKCGKCFLSNSNFIQHQKIHGTENPFSCTECDKWFSSKCELTDHQRVHSGEKTFSCPDCGKTFIKVQNLLKHQRLHTVKNPFSCIECGKIFTSNNYLIRHMTLHRSKKTSYPCETCGKYFNSSSDLTIHQRIHAGGKPGTSSEWRNCFIRKLGFVIHQRNHVKEKPYSCLECKERFMRKSNLFLHQKIHTGEKSVSKKEENLQ
ncbi:uncharacterized protein LOC142311112 [Anomaloglossus baeobatrachus]|uniref:uncharacterized protein LOC142311112 n=1 Tax=Anomaloglossus baeobatrachus TaxID=238106 RepID=UPI003F4F54B8